MNCRGMFIHLSALTATLVSTASVAADAPAPDTEDWACSVLIKRMAANDHLPIRKAKKLWFCDIALDDDGDHPEWYVIGLRSHRDCEICSNLRGWFAVHRITGEVRNWNGPDQAVGERGERL
jgi:hypothetical protein